MTSQAISYNNISHVASPPFDCLKMRPSGSNQLAWFDWDNDIDWRENAIYGMWQTAVWAAPDGPRVSASMVGFDESLVPIKRFDLIMENLVLENVDLTTGSIDIKLRGNDLSWTLKNARYHSRIDFDVNAPLTMHVHGGTSEVVGILGHMHSETFLKIDPGSSLILLGCGTPRTIDPNLRMNFYRPDNRADIDGGTLVLDQSWVVFETGTNALHLRNGGELIMKGSDTQLDAGRFFIEDSTITMQNNTRISGDQLTLRDARIDMSSGALISGLILQPTGGTNIVTIKDQLGGVSGSSLVMSGSGTVMHINGSGQPFTENGNFKNDGLLELGHGTLIIGNDARFWLRRAAVVSSRPEGRLVVEPGGELLVDTYYTLDMGAGLHLENGGAITIEGTLQAQGVVTNIGPNARIDLEGGTLQLATNADVFTVHGKELYFGTDSTLRMRIDPSGALTQRIDSFARLGLNGRPALVLDLVNDTPLPVGTKILLADYEQFDGGHFKGYEDRKIFQLGANTYRIKYTDPYYSEANKTVITLTAGANDPPSAGEHRIYALFANTTNRLPALAAASDPDGDTLSIIEASTAVGTVSIDGGEVVYAPPSGYTGTNMINYCVTDGFFTNCGVITVTVNVLPDATPVNCYDSTMTAQAISLNNSFHSNTPPFNCIELRPAGPNTLFWFEGDREIDWRDIFGDYRMWQTAKWLGPAGSRTSATLVGYDANINPIYSYGLTMENLVLENVDLDTGGFDVGLRGKALSLTLANAKLDSLISFDPAAPLAINVSGGTSEVFGFSGPIDSVTTMDIEADGRLVLLGCGHLRALDPNQEMNFYREGSAADINGGTLILDQSAVNFRSGTNEFRVRNGGLLEMAGPDSKLDADRFSFEQARLLMGNNTTLAGDRLRMSEARLTLESGARLTGFALQPIAGTNELAINSHLGGVENSYLDMMGTDTVFRVHGSESPYAEKGNFINTGPFSLNQGTLIIGAEALYWMLPDGVATTRPAGQIKIERHGVWLVDSGYTVDMGAGLQLDNNGEISVKGTLVAQGTVNVPGSGGWLDLNGGTLELATNTGVLTVHGDSLSFGGSSKLRMRLDPSGTHAQRLDTTADLDLRGLPDLELNLVNDTPLPVGTKIVLCDYNQLEGGYFKGYEDRRIFQFGTNTYRIKYSDPYYSATNDTVITLTAGANDPPTAANGLTFALFMNSTNSLPALSYASDPDGDALSLVSAVTLHGSVGIAGSNLVYAPPPGYTGTNTIDYCITDGFFTNCASLTVTVEAYATNAPRNCFSSGMTVHAPALNNHNHPSMPPYNCLELYPSGPNDTFWFDSDSPIDWRNIYGTYRMWQTVKWQAPDGPRIDATLSWYDGDLATTGRFDVAMEHLVMENVDLDTRNVALKLEGFDLSWELRNARYRVRDWPLTFDASAPLAIRVSGNGSEIAGLIGEVASLTTLLVEPAATLLFTDCGVPGSTNAGERLYFSGADSRVNVNGGTLALDRSVLNVNTGTNAVHIRNAGTLRLTGSNTLLEAHNLVVDASTLSWGFNSRIVVSGSMELKTSATLDIALQIPDPALSNGTKLVLVDYGSLTGSFGNLPDGSIFTLGRNAYRIEYADAVYRPADPTVMTLTVVPWPQIRGIDLNPTGLVFNVEAGPATAAYSLITSTNLFTPLAQWSILDSATLNGLGQDVLILTNWMESVARQRFYSIIMP